MTAVHAERGQVLPLVAICLAVLMGFAGLAVDVGYWEYQQRQQQNAADAAALGGAQALIVAGCPNQTSANNAGKLDATANGYTNGGAVSVTINNPPASGAFSGQSCAVQATVTNNNVSRFFTRLLGSNVIPVTTQAVATLTANDNGCIFLMDPNRVLQMNGTNIDAPSCGILADSQIVQTNGGTINVGSFGYAQSLQNNSTNYPNGQPEKIPPVVDPCQEIPGCAQIAANPPTQSCSRTFTLNGGSGIMTPGCYSSVQINGGTATMSAGTYIFTGVVQHNGGTVIGNGVTMEMTSTAGPFQMNGSTDTFTAPADGATQGVPGVLFYQVPGNTSVVQFNGSSPNLSGLIYAPGALGQINGTNGQYVVMVFGSMQFNGGKTLDLSGPAAGSSLIKNAVLAQ